MNDQETRKNDAQLSQELRRNKRGGAGGKILAALGFALIIIGVIFGQSIPLIVVGALIAGLGQWIGHKKSDSANQQVFETLVPEVLNGIFDSVEISPAGEHFLRAEKSDIPLLQHTCAEESGYIRCIYHELPVELCNVTLTETDEFIREETGLWEKNERTVYTGQWMACRLGSTFPTGLTFWPRGKLDKLLHVPTIRTDSEEFNKRFNLGCDNEQWALQFLNPSRMECILRLTHSAFDDFSVSLHQDGTLYIAVHSDRKFFDIGKGGESPAALRERFSRELVWFTAVMDAFRSA